MHRSHWCKVKYSSEGVGYEDGYRQKKEDSETGLEIETVVQ